MRIQILLFAAATLLAAAQTTHAAIRYVDLNSPNPTLPYTNWATAARVIQDAVDAAATGDEVVVTNGVYATGGRAVDVDGVMTNRVAVDKLLTLRSVNGPEVTIIKGYQVPGTTNGDGAIRCVYLTNGSTLVGFTLTNGATGTSGDFGERSGGGAWCEGADVVIANCVLVSNSASEVGGGVYQGTVNNCVLTMNSGGGAYHAILRNCTLTSNSSRSAGGGAASSELDNCILLGNEAGDGYAGGGAAYSRLNNCVLTGNVGGGAYLGALNNCTVTYNFGFGVAGCAHCAMGGPQYPQVINCIIYSNTEGSDNISFDPQLTDASHVTSGSPCRGAGSAAFISAMDIDGEPWLSPPSIGCDEFYSSATGPLQLSIKASYTNIAAGFTVNLTGCILGHAASNCWDFGDGTIMNSQIYQPWVLHAWANAGDFAVNLTAYNDSYPAGVSASLTIHVVAQPVHYVSLASTNPVPPYTSWATAATNIQDAADIATVGGLVLVTNGTYASGGQVIDWTTNRVAVNRPLNLHSVNGPQVTVIDGAHSMRCVYLANTARLSGFTLTNGYTANNGYTAANGAGVCCESLTTVVSNCVLAGNVAQGWEGGGSFQGTLFNCTLRGNSAGLGGGAARSKLIDCTLTANAVSGSSMGYGGGTILGVLSNCTLTDNSASLGGGGASHSTLNNCVLSGNSAELGGGVFDSALNCCTLVSNSAQYGGGVYGEQEGGGGPAPSKLKNCIIYFNTAPNAANYVDWPMTIMMDYCCTTPLPTNGIGNITNAPPFVNYAGGDVRLQSNSPSINAGNNTDVLPGADLDGNPRIVGGTVDIGAYEFQTPTSLISYAWLQQYGLPTDGSADSTDPDGDGLNNWQEWRCLTDPTNALSALRLLTGSAIGANVTLRWQSVAGVNYFLERSTNLGAQPVFTLLATGLSGQPGTTTHTDSTAIGPGPFFYRVGVSY